MSEKVLDSVEALRIELETSLAKLKVALRHWRQWDAEYEGLKEELSFLEEDSDPQEMANLAHGYGGDLLTDKEIRELTGTDKGKGDSRKPQTIVRMIEQRQDYVSQNVATILKQIAAKESQLDDLVDTAQSQDPQTGPALPISEIIEELDEHDNVISSKVQYPEEATAGMLEALRQAGVTNLAGGEKESASASVRDQKNGNSERSKQPEAFTEPSAAEDRGVSSNKDGLPYTRQEPSTGSRPLTESLINGTFRPGQRVLELGDDDEILASGAILPQDESPEDAALRREMLQYHLNEIGNVVAEIDLLEGDSDDEFVDELADMDEDVSVTSDMSEEEDQHGRNTGPGVTDKYKQEMRELEQRLQGRMMANVGPNFAMDETNTPAEHVESVVLPERKKPSLKPGNSPASGSKSVRFAGELDISPAPEPQSRPAAQAPSQEPVVNTLANTVLERSTRSTAPAAPAEPKPAKISRFKQSRQTDAPQPEPASAPQPILSTSVLERANTGPAPAPEEADEFDPELQRRQLAARYYELRNDMIRQHGGFRTPEDEIDDGQGPLMEEGPDGRVRKVSRFKAARLQR